MLECWPLTRTIERDSEYMQSHFICLFIYLSLLLLYLLYSIRSRWRCETDCLHSAHSVVEKRVCIFRKAASLSMDLTLCVRIHCNARAVDTYRPCSYTWLRNGCEKCSRSFATVAVALLWDWGWRNLRPYCGPCEEYYIFSVNGIIQMHLILCRKRRGGNMHSEDLQQTKKILKPKL
jgi:hypothetical protein